MPITTSALQPLIDARLTGELIHNSRLINEQAVRELVAENPYWSLKLAACVKAGDDEAKLLQIVVESLGVTMADFQSRDSSFIEPERTGERLKEAFTALFTAAAKHQTIALASGHPGSMLELYRWLGEALVAAGAKPWVIPTHFKATHGHYLDQVGGIVVLSDEGSLMHSHDDEGLSKLLTTDKPDFIVADHGFAATGVNHGIPTVAFFDTDDPALPIAATVVDSLIAVPMNDNQTNGLTAAAVREFWEQARDAD